MTIDTPTIYGGSDSKFFRSFGISFIRSFKHHNPTMDIFYHIMDPKDGDLSKLEELPCEYSVSYSDKEFLLECSKNVASKDGYSPLDIVIAQWYRSQRFIELSKIWSGKHLVLAYDVDTVAINPIPFETLCQERDQGCLDVKGNQVVSLTAFRNNSQLLREWGRELDGKIAAELFSPGLDQDVFVSLARNYDVEMIEMIYCNYSKKNFGFVITGKGMKKSSGRFETLVREWNH